MKQKMRVGGHASRKDSCGSAVDETWQDDDVFSFSGCVHGGKTAGLFAQNVSMETSELTMIQKRSRVCVSVYVQAEAFIRVKILCQ